jgi:hypothetical protein
MVKVKRGIALGGHANLVHPIAQGPIRNGHTYDRGDHDPGTSTVQASI